MAKDFVGFGALGEALTALEREKYRRVFVVVSRGGWERFNSKGTQPFFHGRECGFFHDYSPNPDFAEIRDGCARYQAFGPDLLVAIGGGSSMDVAKAIKALAHTRESFDPESPGTIKPSGEGPPLTAIATTAGSGSEATRYAVFYRGERKQTISGPSLRPESAVVDPELTYGMPPRLTAETGFDALSQAVESYWGSLATPESRELSARAVACALPNIYNAVHEPGPANRFNMANAAYLSGLALNTARTTLPHALGYHLTKRYGLAHGHAVALTLPFFLVINAEPGARIAAPAGPDRHRETMRGLFGLLGQETAGDAAFFWRNLMRHCGLEATFAEVGLKSEGQMRELIASVDPTRLGNHPVAVDPESLLRHFMETPDA